MATLEQFLRTGELGPIQFGMTADETIAVLGPPGSWTDHPDMPYQAYGGLHLTYKRTRPDPKPQLAHVGLYFDSLRGPIPERVRPTDWLPTPETTETEFRDFLNRIGITRPRLYRNESDYHLFLPTGARATFANDRLYSVQFSAPHTAMKTISISVPEDTLTTLRDRAKKANRSVAALCAEWINEKANSPN